MKRNMIPLILFAGLVAFLAVGLTLNPKSVPSPLIGQKLPEFTLPSLTTRTMIHAKGMRGKVWLLNVWASWCEACHLEHKHLVRLQKETDFALVGLNYKDSSEEARLWLKQNENPYNLVIEDQKGSLGLDLGVYGVPETFVIDAEGIIQYKFTGPLTKKEIRDNIVPLMTKLRDAIK